MVILSHGSNPFVDKLVACETSGLAFSANQKAVTRK
jgi:hypothetical protein